MRPTLLRGLRKKLILLIAAILVFSTAVGTAETSVPEEIGYLVDLGLTQEETKERLEKQGYETNSSNWDISGTVHGEVSIGYKDYSLVYMFENNCSYEFCASKTILVQNEQSADALETTARETYDALNSRLDDAFGAPFSSMGNDGVYIRYNTLFEDDTLTYHGSYTINRKKYEYTDTLADYRFYLVELGGKNVILRNELIYTSPEDYYTMKLTGTLIDQDIGDQITAVTGLTLGKTASDQSGGNTVSPLVPVPTATPKPVTVSSGSTDGFAYDVTNEGTVVITGYTGSNADVSVPAEIEGKPVTEIGEKAFNRVSKVRLPNTLQSIGDLAFFDSGLTRINLPESLTHIGAGAFAGCGPEIVFGGKHPCFALLDHGLYHKASKTLVAAFGGIEKVPDGVETIGDYAFYGMKNLPADLLPDTVRSIGNHAFEKTSFSGGLSLPVSLLKIGAYAFAGASCQCKRDGDSVAAGFSSAYALEYLSERDRIVADAAAKTSALLGGGSGQSSYTYYSFTSCFILPRSLAELGEHAFEGFSIIDPDFSSSSSNRIHTRTYKFNISSIQVNEIPDSCFANASIFHDKLTLPSVETIGNRAFLGFPGDVALPVSVKTVGDFAFQGSRTVTLGTVETIGERSFDGCYVESLPDTLASIGAKAFASSRMKELTLPAGIAAIGEGAFPANITLYVTEGSYAQRWAQENGYWCETAGDAAEPEEDTDWLN